MRKSGITSTTPQDFILNAGVVFKNFKYVWKEATEQTEGAIQIVADSEVETEKTSSRASCGISRNEVDKVGLAEILR